ncbi:MAG TPA: hypothetical protein VMU26_15900 [Candidatus Polarisedimenticolia bacterium]|nr:hypothetical protein [Candidatus Polarisedimenticolia bacterium]
MRSDLARAGPSLVEETEPFHCVQFRVGGVSVQVSGKCGNDVTLVSSLEPFRVPTAAFDIKILIKRTPRLSRRAGRELFDSGSVWRLYQDGNRYRFDFSTPAMGDNPYKRLLVDAEFRRAILLMSNESLARVTPAAAPLDYPLDELLIMHRLTQEKAIELHSCGIVRPDGTGNLFVGHSGAGKSTTTRLWTAREDVEVLSDDRIIVRRDEDRGQDLLAPATGESAFEAAGGADEHEVLRIYPRSAPRNSRRAQVDSGRKKMRIYGTPWHGEAAYASPASAPLARIFILQHGYGNLLTLLSPSQAVAELFARSFVPFHRHEYVESALTFLQEVVDNVPCYRYAFEPNEGAVERIVNFRD